MSRRSEKREKREEVLYSLLIHRGCSFQEERLNGMEWRWRLVKENFDSQRGCFDSEKCRVGV